MHSSHCNHTDIFIDYRTLSVTRSLYFSMLKKTTETPIKPAKRLECFVAESNELIQEAQKLRYRIFAQELGAKLKSPVEGLDLDEVDPYCDHLIVFDNNTQKIVGYTRLLTDVQAQKLGRFYSQGEFNMNRVLEMPGRFLEVGRTCVDPDFRGGAVLTTLWSALVEYALTGGFNYLLGCASITPGPSGFAVDAVYRSINAKNIAPESYQVTPTLPVPAHLRCNRDESGIPPLLKAYLRFGALICGEPCWDKDFNCMDLLVLLPLDQVQERYSKHFMKDFQVSNEINTSASL